ncbi:hypothetical protein HME9302_00883 [Alteripontixanthobacter maritimus]|uniref:Methyltransferase type 11 domain-containing protein n=1 Tax=Alteripontixanthobacter maritimus TaxID=2161824 RepID=A0A369Q475_9SPHN|nr:methyltransferase domain-containing protein [Alteripontixanthobacter maritimus]RDC59691.1 hypothetical protein HME9302_00883 [Alteripontixanthobacter maritimus]
MSLSDPRNNRSLSYKLRSRRDRFLRKFLVNNGRRILDLGGTAHYWRRVGLNFLNENGFTVTIVNLEANDLGTGPFKMLVGDATQLDLPDGSFDIVHSNSVIEHVGGQAEIAAFACETRRLAPAHYVQTPNFWFPIDPHFWKFPGFHWLPESVRARLLQKFSIATAGRIGDYQKALHAVRGTRLLSIDQCKALFPESKLTTEKFLGLNKSLILYRNAS